MPEPAPAPMENPHLRALEEEAMWWLKEGPLAAAQNLIVVNSHEAQFKRELRAALQYEKQLFERTRDVRVESHAESLIVGALNEFIRHPNPRWNVQPQTHWTLARRFVVTLPSTLDAVWQSGGRPSSITAVDVHHWLEEHIASICPYACPA